MLSKHLTKYMLSNRYLDTSLQKVGTPGVSGWIEHTRVLTQLIREAPEDKGKLTVIWLDLSNAYGTIPHKVVQETLRRYYVPTKVMDIIKTNYSKFYLRFSYSRGEKSGNGLKKVSSPGTQSQSYYSQVQ